MRLQFIIVQYLPNIHELPTVLEQSATPVLTLFNNEVKFQLYADYLVLWPPTGTGES